jgi:hypothetical protein
MHSRDRGNEPILYDSTQPKTGGTYSILPFRTKKRKGYMGTWAQSPQRNGNSRRR